EVAPSGRAADRPGPGPAPDSLAGWVSDLRRRPDEPDAFDGAARTGAANGRSTPAAPPPARSFFEPAAGRTGRRSSPLDQPQRTGDRAVPPSRLGQGGQPFPRRRPLHEPVREDPTRAFPMDGAETTHALGSSRSEEPPGPFQLAPPPAAGDDATQALPRRRPGAGGESEVDGRTQPVPVGDGGPAVPPGAEELPPSIAEPVSAPPAGRRGFSPIVIEGTVIESRDLTGPAEEPAARPDTGSAPVTPEVYAVPTVPAAASAMATASAAPAYRADGEAPAAPWAGPAEPTVPLTIDPAAGESRSAVDGPTDPVAARVAEAPDVPVPSPAPDGPSGGRVGSFFEPVAPPAEPTVPLFGGSAPADPSPPVNPTDERTEPVFDAAADRSLFEPAGRAQRRTEPPYPPAGPAEDRTEPLSAPVVPPAQERTEPPPGPAVVAPPAWTAPSEDRTESLSVPADPARCRLPAATSCRRSRTPRR
ncbi:hypothetical protein ACWEVO_36485, partial [Micromonospora sp. NPDC003776]